MNGSALFIGNRGGIPIISATPTVGTADVRLSLPNNAFRFLGMKGLVVIQLTAAIASGTTGTLPVLAEVNGQTRPLTNASGAEMTASDIGSVTALTVLFDKSANSLQVLSQTI